MAVYTGKEKFTPKDLKYVSTLDIPVFDTKDMYKAIDYDIKLRDKQTDKAEKNYGLIADAKDDLLGLRYDTAEQKALYDSKREEYGISPNMFAKIDVNALNSPFEARSIVSQVKAFMADPKIVDAQKEIWAGDNFRKTLDNIKDPRLRTMAEADYMDYRNSKRNATTLSPKDYETVDLSKELVNVIKLIPETDTSIDYKSASGNLEGTKLIKQRHLGATKQVVSSLVKSDPSFAKNMIVNGYMTQDGTITAGGQAYMDNLINAYTKANTTLQNVKEVGGSLTGVGSNASGASYMGGGGYRFGNKSENERQANYIDQAISDGGYADVDASSVLAAAQSKGRIGKADRDYPELGIKQGDMALLGQLQDGRFIAYAPLRRLSSDEAKKRSARQQSLPVNLTGTAYDDITSMIGGAESGGSGGYDAVGQKSKESVALGKYQFFPTWHGDAIRSALSDIGIDYTTVDPDPRINNERGNMKDDLRRLGTAFLRSPEAQEKVWQGQYKKLYNQAHDLASRLVNSSDYVTNEGNPYSITELMYILHHEGSLDSAEKFIKTGVSSGSSINPAAAAETTSALRRIRATLDGVGLTGEISDSGNMMTKPTSEVPMGYNPSPQVTTPTSVMDIKTD